MSHIEAIEQQINSLSKEDKLQLLSNLLESLQIDSPYEKEWIEETYRRFQLYQKGKMDSCSAKVVIEKLRLRINMHSN